MSAIISAVALLTLPYSDQIDTRAGVFTARCNSDDDVVYKIGERRVRIPSEGCNELGGVHIVGKVTNDHFDYVVTAEVVTLSSYNIRIFSVPSDGLVRVASTHGSDPILYETNGPTRFRIVVPNSGMASSMRFGRVNWACDYRIDFQSGETFHRFFQSDDETIPQTVCSVEVDRMYR